VAFLTALASSALGDEADQVLITYEMKVGGKDISGASRSLQWSAIPLDAQSAQIQLRIPVRSFDSGHPEFDSLLRAALEAERHPFIEVEGIARGRRFEGTLTLRGVAQPLAVATSVVRAGNRVIATSSFAINLQDFGISLPKTGGRVRIDFAAGVSMNPQAVHAGGALNSN